MGINIDSAKFLLTAKRAGVSFERTLTLGRQWLFADLELLNKLLLENDISAAVGNVLKKAPYADQLFHLLGAKTLDVLDNSDYEGAGLIHDLNLSLPSEFENRYDFVFDGGTIEHVFHASVAMQSCMRLLKKGGHFCTWTPANNECGHGFYQFGPELFFRLFQPVNGFRLRSIVVVEKHFSDNRWYHVQDSRDLGARVCCINSSPLFVMALAEKVGDVPSTLDVQQSDYVEAWRESTEDSTSSVSRTGIMPRSQSLKNRFASALPEMCAERLKAYYRHYLVARLTNRKFFQRIADKQAIIK